MAYNESLFRFFGFMGIILGHSMTGKTVIVFVSASSLENECINSFRRFSTEQVHYKRRIFIFALTQGPRPEDVISLKVNIIHETSGSNP